MEYSQIELCFGADLYYHMLYPRTLSLERASDCVVDSVGRVRGGAFQVGWGKGYFYPFSSVMTKLDLTLWNDFERVFSHVSGDTSQNSCICIYTSEMKDHVMGLHGFHFRLSNILFGQHNFFKTRVQICVLVILAAKGNRRQLYRWFGRKKA